MKKQLKEGQELGDFVLISKTNYQKWLNVKKQKSDSGKKAWSKLTAKERSIIASKRGRAGALKRWGNKK